jgi:hypothetical protein
MPDGSSGLDETALANLHTKNQTIKVVARNVRIEEEAGKEAQGGLLVCLENTSTCGGCIYS